MNSMKRLTVITLLLLMVVATMQAQEEFPQTPSGVETPDWARWHYLSEEEMYDTSRGRNFVETNPPAGEPRFVAEFEPMQGVMIRYPLGIPTNLVVQLSNNCMVYCIVSSSYQNQARSSFQNAGVNMNNVTFVNASSDSYWVRDYGPWYIFEDRNPAIVDNVYNRPRPNDDNMSGVFANFWDIPMYGMNLEHTGGNMMEDGRGHGVSDNLVLQENNDNETNVRNKMRDYLGIDPYHITIDPQGDYIAHVDCWGKYLAPDKILIARVPQSNSHYNDYENVANYFATTNCCWGYPYHVYRVDEPGGNTLAPYTNSLILNKTVYVPLGTNSTYNNNALTVYQQAMPGYNIVGVSSGSPAWQNTDALHCRTRGVMDFNMLFVDHRNVIFGEQEWQDSIPVISKFIAYSGANLKQDSLLVYYSIDNGAYQVANMTTTGNPDEYVGYIKGYQDESSINYYVFGADESGHRYTQPVFAELDPHHFTMEAHEPMVDDEMTQTIDIAQGWNWWSSYVELDGANSLNLFEQGLGNAGVQIKAQNGFVMNYGGMWMGTLDGITNEDTYLVEANTSFTMELTGIMTHPSNHPIILTAGWNWIGYPCTISMSLDEAFSNFTPSNGDEVKSQEGYAVYYSGFGWMGNLQKITPGMGLMYYSSAGGTLIYPENR